MNNTRLVSKLQSKLSRSPFLGRFISKHNVSPSSSFLRFSGFSTKSPEVHKLPEKLDILKDAYKMRINQLKLIRVGMKAAKKECFREFEVVDALTEKKLLFVKLRQAEKVEKYRLVAYEFSSGEDGEGLLEILLERNHALHTIAARIYSPPFTPIGYVFDLEGLRRTAIIQNGTEDKCLFQIQTVTPSGWTENGKIFSGRGEKRLGHFIKLGGYKKHQIMLYIRLHQDLDTISKCNLIAATMFLMTYDYLR